MASIFKRTYSKTVGGKRVKRKTQKWYIEYIDHDGRPRRLPGYTDRIATEQYAAELERTAQRIRAGILDHRELSAASVPLVQHVGDYLEVLEARGRSPKHVAVTSARLNAAIAGLGWETASSADGAALERWLAKQKHLAARTRNYYLQAVKSLFAWLHREGRLARDPLARLRPVDVEPDQRRARRALTADEFARLIATAQTCPRRLHGLTGPLRAALYLTAALTGLRSSELASLTADSLHLDGPAPTITIDAGRSKRRRRDVLPIPTPLVDVLRPLAASSGPLWPGDWSPYHGADLIRHDLAAAEIPFEVNGRRFDFHALRGQFVTSLARAGVALVVAQRLARHSTPALTANVYSHLDATDLRAGIERLTEMLAGKST